MQISLKDIPDEIILEYNLLKIVCNCIVYTKITKCMCGFKETGIITFKRLIKYVKPHGYFPVKHILKFGATIYCQQPSR